MFLPKPAYSFQTKLHEPLLFHLPLGPLLKVGEAFSMFSCCSTWCSESFTAVDVVTTGSKIGGAGGSVRTVGAAGTTGGSGVGLWFLHVAFEAFSWSA